MTNHLHPSTDDDLGRLPTTVAECGIVQGWDSDDLEAVKEHHSELWEEEKESWGLRNGEPLEWLPGFTDSVQRLLDMGYTYTDIGAFFGVSREAVRLWCEKHDLERMDQRGTKPRVWSWEEERFIAVSNDEYVRRVREAYLRARRRQHEERQQRVIRAIRALHQQKGRPPTIDEITEETGVAHTTLATWWGRHHQRPDLGRSYAEAWEAMYLDAGVRRPKATWTKDDGRWWHRGQD